MRYYIDCEFDGHNGPLLQMACVRENGVSMVCTVAVETVYDPWVIENVVPVKDAHEGFVDGITGEGIDLYEVGNAMRWPIDDATDKHPVIIADSPVDIARFCKAISTGKDGGWASVDYPSMTFEVHNVDSYPTDLEGAVQHNAYWDAMALRHRLTVGPAKPKLAVVE